MRISDRLTLGCVALLAGCGDGKGEGRLSEVVTNGMEAVANLTRPAPGPVVIACKVGQVAAFADDCTLEPRGTDAGGRRILVIAHKAGGFRRLLVARDGTLGQADGAEPVALVRQDKGVAEIAIGTDRYRLIPAQLRVAP